MSVTTSDGALGSSGVVAATSCGKDVSSSGVVASDGGGGDESSRPVTQRYAPKPMSPPTTISTTNVATTRRRIRRELDSASSHELPGGKSAKLLGSVSTGYRLSTV